MNYPNSDLSYTANFLYMLDYMGQHVYEVNPVLAKALDVGGEYAYRIRGETVITRLADILAIQMVRHWIEAEQGALAPAFDVRGHFLHPTACLVWLVGNAVVAKHVGGKRNITKFSRHGGAFLGVVV